MTLTSPYSLEYFADQLPIASVIFDIKRNDELAGNGGSDVIAIEMADPLWMATVTLARTTFDAGKQVAAKIRALRGPMKPLWLYDPQSKYPQSDPDGSILGASTVTVAAVGSGFASISLQGLPAGYVLTLSDKMQIAYGSSPVRYAFLEVSETKTANGSGVSGLFEVFPNVPAGMAVGDAVTLIKPALRCVIMPDTHSPGTNGLKFNEGQTFQVIQKKR